MLQRVHVEEHMDDRLGGPNSVGRKFLSYCKNENVNPLDSIPDVDIKFKVYRISDFDGKRGTFYVDFVLMLDWLDPSLELCENNNPDFHEHYWPKPELLNLSPDSPDLPDFESIVPKYKKDEKNFIDTKCKVKPLGRNSSGVSTSQSLTNPVCFEGGKTVNHFQD